MKFYHTFRRGMTMIELIIVIIILGIVASIGSEIIAKTYESYIIQRALYRATMKTELALSQIANRLRYAIPETVGFRTTTGSAFKTITETNTGNDKVLQWVAYDGDSFEANTTPGWSGFCDLNASTQTTLSTPGSNLDFTNYVIDNLSAHQKDISDAYIYFPDGTSYGVNAATGETITLDSTIPIGSDIYERYKLAWSSYALSVEGGDLYLYYNFSPTFGASLNANGISKTLLLKNVTNFRFKGSPGAIRIKICKEERIGLNADATVHTCKEKVIF